MPQKPGNLDHGQEPTSSWDIETIQNTTDLSGLETSTGINESKTNTDLESTTTPSEVTMRKFTEGDADSFTPEGDKPKNDILNFLEKIREDIFSSVYSIRDFEGPEFNVGKDRRAGGKNYDDYLRNHGKDDKYGFLNFIEEIPKDDYPQKPLRAIMPVERESLPRPGARQMIFPDKIYPGVTDEASVDALLAKLTKKFPLKNDEGKPSNSLELDLTEEQFPLDQATAGREVDLTNESADPLNIGGKGEDEEEK